MLPMAATHSPTHSLYASCLDALWPASHTPPVQFSCLLFCSVSHDIISSTVSWGLWLLVFLGCAFSKCSVRLSFCNLWGLTVTFPTGFCSFPTGFCSCCYVALPTYRYSPLVSTTISIFEFYSFLFMPFILIEDAISLSLCLSPSSIHHFLRLSLFPSLPPFFFSLPLSYWGFNIRLPDC